MDAPNATGIGRIGAQDRGRQSDVDRLTAIGRKSSASTEGGRNRAGSIHRRIGSCHTVPGEWRPGAQVSGSVAVGVGHFGSDAVRSMAESVGIMSSPSDA